MKVRKTIYIIVLALASVALTAAAGPIIIMVNGVGQANDPDRNASYQAADQDAQDNMASHCPGTIISSHRATSECRNNNDGSDLDNTTADWACTIGYMGQCQVN